MAIYKIFSEKDATLYSDYSSLNSGMDPILELTKNTSLNYYSQSTAARIITKFSDDDISSVITSSIGTGSFKAYVKLYLANSTALPTDYTIEALAVSGSWDMGTGRFGDSPITDNGVSWVYRKANSTFSWQTGSFPAGVTGSFTSLNRGGGNWYTAYHTTQSFGVYTKKDIEIDVTNIVLAHISGTIQNDGILIKTSGSLEFDENYNYILNFFSRDTNTVYPPVLEFKWDDSSYNVSGSSGTLTTDQDIRVSITNNKGEFSQYEKYKFKLNVRDSFPVRTFTTSSLYTQPKYLPSSSYYAIKDVKADIMVVDFDTNYTKISADTNGNYFLVDMYGLEPERYYKILIKTIIGGSTIIFDDRYFFKVIE